jgi:hypothetical protein
MALAFDAAQVLRQVDDQEISPQAGTRAQEETIGTDAPLADGERRA